MIPIPPYIPSWSPVPVVTPFTYRDGVTMLKKVDGIIRYLNRTIVPFINETNQKLADKVQEDINNMINVVNTAITALESETDSKLADMQTTVNNAINYVNTSIANLTTYVDEQVQLIIQDGVQVQDPVMKGIMQNASSQTRTVTDSLYAGINFVPENGKKAVGKDELKISVLDYGAKGDSDGGVNGTNDVAAINAAIAAAVANKRTLWFPRVTNGYRANASIIIPGTIDVLMESPIISVGHQDIGIDYNPTGPIATRRNLTFMQRRGLLSDWQTFGEIGVRTTNLIESVIFITEIVGNTIGYQRVGNGQGHVHNTTTVQTIRNNRIAIDCDSLGVGWVNEELTIGGRLTNDSGIHLDTSRTGVRIRSSAGYSNNAHTYLKTSFELNSTGLTGGAEALPIEIIDGEENKFLEVRSEGNSPTLIRVSGKGQNNYVSVTYGSLLNDLVDDQSLYASTFVDKLRSLGVDKAEKIVLNEQSIHTRVIPYDNAQFNIPGFVINASNSANSFRQLNNFTISLNYLEIPASRAIGKFIDTSLVKRFVIDKSADAGFGGRYIVRCYDAAGNVLNPVDYPGIALLRSGSSHLATYGTSWGGAYSTGSDSNNPFLFLVRPEVKKVFVGVSGGSQPVRIRALRILTDQTGIASVIDQFPENVTVPVAAQAPTSGTWNTGMRVLNGVPAVGQPRGWVCTVSGSPGTWVAESNL